MTQSPILSVITPVLNNDRFIGGCIENVLQQDCSGVEHVIVDGGSTDMTVDLVREYAREYDHIVFTSETDKGQSDAMNKGISMSRGSIVGFLNVDDYYEVGSLRYALDVFRTLPVPSLLVGNCNVWNDDGQIMAVYKPRKINLVNILLGNFIEAFPMNPSSYFYHKSLHERIGYYDVEEHFALDVEFLLRAIPNANISYVDRVLGNYRYINGTKTFEDVKNGTADARLRNLLNRYRQQLSIGQKSYLSLLRLERKINGVLRTVYGTAARFRSFLRMQPFK
jgi:glycosyltransferase involved in cell wall biosynthesis